jgi:hypothetical protein
MLENIKMSKEQQGLLDEAYENYCKSFENQTLIEEYSFDTDPMTQFMFINKCKTDTEFSEKWGLAIKEQELSMSERGELFRKTYPGKSVDDFAPSGMEVQSIRHQLDTRYKNANIPTKLITMTYNDKTIESYE